jgi:N-acetylglutamate synthase-like GNAT family acetyltransferase
MSGVSIRIARSDEAERLTDLAMRAKASWGYDAAFMEQCRAELKVTPEKMGTWTVWVAEHDGQLAGVIALATDGVRAEVEEFMVEPCVQGVGTGQALMDTLLAECRRLGLQSVGLDADPNAETIYLKFGFSTVGRSPSQSIPGRTLPSPD